MTEASQYQSASSIDDEPRQREVLLSLEDERGSIRIERSDEAFFVDLVRTGDLDPNTGEPDTATPYKDDEFDKVAGEISASEYTIRSCTQGVFGAIYRHLGYESETTSERDDKTQRDRTRLTFPRAQKINAFLDQHPGIFSLRYEEHPSGYLESTDYINFFSRGVIPVDSPDQSAETFYYLLHDSIDHGTSTLLTPPLVVRIIQARAQSLLNMRERAKSEGLEPEKARLITEAENNFTGSVDELTASIGLYVRGSARNAIKGTNELVSSVNVFGESAVRFDLRSNALFLGVSALRHRRRLLELNEQLKAEQPQTA